MDTKVLIIAMMATIIVSLIVVILFLFASGGNETITPENKTHESNENTLMSSNVICEISFPKEVHDAFLSGSGSLKYKAPNRLNADIQLTISSENQSGELIMKSIATGQRVYSYTETSSSSVSFNHGDWTEFSYENTWLSGLSDLRTLEDLEIFLEENMDSALLNGIPLTFSCENTAELPNSEFSAPI